MSPRILIVDDEAQMRRLLKSALGSKGYDVVEAKDAAEAIAIARAEEPALILLDLGLPDADGLDVVDDLRRFTRVPIIVVSARGREDDKVYALESGADDYVTKPFSTGELLARVRVALRHAAARTKPVEPVIAVDRLRIDTARRVVSVGGEDIHLTPIEYKLLVLLAENAGRVLTHRQMLDEVWGRERSPEKHYLRVHLVELRKKIEVDPARPALILTEPGVGYRFRELT